MVALIFKCFLVVDYVRSDQIRLGEIPHHGRFNVVVRIKYPRHGSRLTFFFRTQKQRFLLMNIDR